MYVPLGLAPQGVLIKYKEGPKVIPVRWMHDPTGQATRAQVHPRP